MNQEQQAEPAQEQPMQKVEARIGFLFTCPSCNAAQANHDIRATQALMWGNRIGMVCQCGAHLELAIGHGVLIVPQPVQTHGGWMSQNISDRFGRAMRR